MATVPLIAPRPTTAWGPAATVAVVSCVAVLFLGVWYAIPLRA